jgi:hypothetical protein
LYAGGLEGLKGLKRFIVRAFQVSLVAVQAVEGLTKILLEERIPFLGKDLRFVLAEAPEVPGRFDDYFEVILLEGSDGLELSAE